MKVLDYMPIGIVTIYSTNNIQYFIKRAKQL